MPIALKEGQFQIGDLVFGAGTDIRVATFQKESYEVQTMDLPMARSDEIRFGKDSLTPTPITLELGIMDNYSIFEGPKVPMPGQDSASDLQSKFAMEWRADRERRVWNSQKPLYYCKRGIQKVVYGRPRKFTQGWDRYGSEFVPIVAQYQPVDPLSYDANPKQVTAVPGTNMTVNRSNGEIDAWFEAYINGPINKPQITIDYTVNSIPITRTITVDYNLPADTVLHISSYPWQRRCIASNGQNLSAFLIGDSPYLDELTLPPNTTSIIKMTGTGTTAATNITVSYREAYASL